MNDEGNSIIGTGGLTFISIYCLSLLLVGWLGHRAKKENSLADFYLGGGGFGFRHSDFGLFISSSPLRLP